MLLMAEYKYAIGMSSIEWALLNYWAQVGVRGDLSELDFGV
jgi:hypothetical protein